MTLTRTARRELHADPVEPSRGRAAGPAGGHHRQALGHGPRLHPEDGQDRPDRSQPHEPARGVAGDGLPELPDAGPAEGAHRGVRDGVGPDGAGRPADRPTARHCGHRAGGLSRGIHMP